MAIEIADLQRLDADTRVFVDSLLELGWRIEDRSCMLPDASEIRIYRVKHESGEWVWGTEWESQPKPLSEELAESDDASQRWFPIAALMRWPA